MTVGVHGDIRLTQCSGKSGHPHFWGILPDLRHGFRNPNPGCLFHVLCEMYDVSDAMSIEHGTLSLWSVLCFGVMGFILGFRM